MSKNNNRYITIMAGGVGSRFWPASTEDTPKQFLDILGVGKKSVETNLRKVSQPCTCGENLDRDQ